MQENEYPGNGQPPVSDMPPTEGHTPSAPQPAYPAAEPPASARAGREAVRRSTKKASACFGSACAPAPLVTGLVLLLLFAMGAWLLYEFAAVLLSAAGAPDVCYPVAGALAVGIERRYCYGRKKEEQCRNIRTGKKRVSKVVYDTRTGGTDEKKDRRSKSRKTKEGRQFLYGKKNSSRCSSGCRSVYRFAKYI